MESNPADGTSDNGQAVFTRAAGSYNRIGPRHFSFFAKRLVDFTGVKAGERVLDVATGSGEILFAAAQRVGADGFLVGIDLSEEMLARAAHRFGNLGSGNVTLQVADAQQLQFAAEFDRVFCGFALDSIPDADAVLAGMRRALRPGGLLGLVEAPSWYFLHDDQWAQVVETFRALGVSVGTYDPDRERGALTGAVDRAGFQDITAIQETCPLDFGDADQWWDWMWSHGTRSLLERVPDQQLDSARRALTAALPVQAHDGTIHGRLLAHIIVARRSP